MAEEFDFISQLRQRAQVRSPVVTGIGDDAAVLQHHQSTREVVTTDMLMDGIDFIVGEAPPELIGRKCLAVNLSDLAAMGARPTAAFVAVALPRSEGRSFAERLFDGIFALADQFKVTIAGGDTNSWDGPLVVTVTAMGDVTKHGPVMRSGARDGDSIFVTGDCGGSIGGRHFSFTPRIAEAKRLLEILPVHAMIDISDGLAADLHHILEESDAGAVLDATAIPIHQDVSAELDPNSRLVKALGDGEDFELLFTIARQDEPKLLSQWDLPARISRIGMVTPPPEVWLRTADGTLQPLPKLGWSHELSHPTHSHRNHK